MTAAHAELVKLLLGRLPTEDEAPHVIGALSAGAKVTYIQPRPGAPLRAVILVESHSAAGDAAHLLRPGRDAAEQLAALGAELDRREKAPTARILNFPGQGAELLATAEEHAERVVRRFTDETPEAS